jgi:hypothetical protein
LQNGNEQQKFGEPLSDFSLQSLSGATVTLSSRLEEKGARCVVIWSSTCSHCIRYDKYLNSFEARLSGAEPDRGLGAAGRDPGFGQNGRGSEEADVLHRARSGSGVARQWFTQQTPRAFLMDANRALLYRGAIDNYKFAGDPEYVAYLEPAIDQFLSGSAVARQETSSYGCAIQSVYYILPKAFTKSL